VVVVLIDGGDPAYVNAALTQGLLPNFKKLMTEGFVSVAVGAMPSFTNPNNISVITGVPPSVHGISGNFFLNPATGQEAMMDQPQFLRADSILAKFSEHGAKVVAITAKDKLAKMLAYKLQDGISFSAEKADKCTKKDNGIDNCPAYVGKPLPSEYSADLSLFVLEAGVRILEREKPDLMYLSLSDYIQHKYAPGSKEATEYYVGIDQALGRLVALGATMACSSFRITFKKAAAVFLVCVALSGLVYKSWDTLLVRYGQVSLKDEYLGDHFENRGSYLRQAWAILEDRLFGVGLNNWSYWVSEVYGPQLGIFYEAYPNTNDAPSKDAVQSFTFAPPAHSLVALTAGELGWPGLLIFLLVWLRWFQMGASFLRRRSPEAMHRLGAGFFFSTCGIFLQSQTEWTYRQTHIFYTFNVLLGALASLYYVKRQAARTPIDTNAVTEEFSSDVPSAEPPLACR